ncbi:hypothetical protein P3T27_004229 [Kitasatospora sp. MAA19]|uniref:hypothetical protein n=1 Tax=unclassified Kitasatospora TaxID=2633591 RepID=UPI0024736F76|nr:hypothetical protein [Kitasatospora sp. MAA19]MDH6707492.1 hypothetical protein [Kitasatospora sp. MAA19]
MRTRPLVAALALAGATVLPAAAPAAVQGDTVHLDVSGQRNGHVSTVATWENDHDPVTGEFVGTLAAASSDGRTVGPWRLVAVPGEAGTYTTREMLPAGHWRVTVDCAFPSPGHGERELDVEAPVIGDPPLSGAAATTGPASTAIPAPAPPTQTSTVPPALDGAAPARPVARGTPSDTTPDAATWAAIGTAAAAVVLVATGFWLRRRPHG